MHFCCFNRNSREAIHDGIRRRIAMSERMTGQEFRTLLTLDCDEIRLERQTDQNANLDDSLTGLVEIPVVRERLGNSGI